MIFSLSLLCPHHNIVTRQVPQLNFNKDFGARFEVKQFKEHGIKNILGSVPMDLGVHNFELNIALEEASAYLIVGRNVGTKSEFLFVYECGIFCHVDNDVRDIPTDVAVSDITIYLLFGQPHVVWVAVECLDDFFRNTSDCESKALSFMAWAFASWTIASIASVLPCST